MKRPLNAVKPDITTMRRAELKTYLSVLSDETSWNPSLRYLVRVGEINVQEEKAAVEKQLGYSVGEGLKQTYNRLGLCDI